MVNVLAWIVIGGLAGWLASLVVRGTGLGIVGDILVGIVGAIVGGLVLSMLLPGSFGIASLNLGTWCLAFLSAVILLYLVRGIGKTARDPMCV
jgi:uncharacterized membrane protein YeaQ/YmgE (transglycosylase-associated protein family)